MADMSSFTGELTITHPDKDCTFWTLFSDFTYQLNSGGEITAPAGFTTNGANVPRLFWTLYPPSGILLRPSIIHDYLYARLEENNPHPFATTRKKADAIFYEASRVAGVNIVSAFVMWASLRMFGSLRG